MPFARPGRPFRVDGERERCLSATRRIGERTEAPGMEMRL
jgi:hypothetical protein